MAVSDEEIDRLFQLPLDEFTPARNALAKGAGPDGPALKRLHRPQAAAWAVNQLYWRRRKVYDRLIAAAERLRGAHSQLLAGKKVDLAAAEQAHRDAVKASMEEIRGLFGETGEKATPATMTAVQETLQALPRPEPPGRLVRPLKPLGFEALAGLFGGGAAVPRRAAEVVPFDRGRRDRDAEHAPAPTRQQESAQRQREEKERAREAEARKRDAARRQKELTAAKAVERDARETLARTRQALQKAERDHAALEQRLESLVEDVKRLTKEAGQHERDLATATHQRERLELKN